MKISLKGASYSDGLIYIANRVPDRMRTISSEEIRDFLVKASRHISELEKGQPPRKYNGVDDT